MAHPRHPLPALTPSAWCAAVVAPLLAVAIALLPWIPSWLAPMKLVAIALSIAGVTATLAYAIARIRSASSISRRGKRAMVLAIFGQLLSVALVCLSPIEFFAPEYAYSIETRGARAFVYNNGKSRATASRLPATTALTGAATLRPHQKHRPEREATAPTSTALVQFGRSANYGFDRNQVDSPTAGSILFAGSAY